MTRSQLFGGILSLVAAVAFGCSTVYLADREAHLGAGAPIADAVVVDVVGSGKNRDVIVDFTTRDGRPVEAQTEEFVDGPHVRAGYRLRVRYDAAQPEKYVRDVRWAGSAFVPFMTGAFAVAFLWYGVLGVRRRLPAWIKFQVD